MKACDWEEDGAPGAFVYLWKEESERVLSFRQSPVQAEAADDMVWYSAPVSPFFFFKTSARN